jgi:hypothetical protein
MEVYVYTTEDVQKRRQGRGRREGKEKTLDGMQCRSAVIKNRRKE